MKRQGLTSGYGFSGNPVIFADADASGEVKEAIYRITMGGNTVYEGRYSLPATLNISEIIDNEISAVGLLPCAPNEWITKALDLGEESANVMQLFVDYDNGGDYESSPIRFIPGKIPTALYRALELDGKDIFTERFLNPETNFIMTTRTTGTMIEIPETELMPLAVLMPGGKSITVEAGGRKFRSSNLQAGIYWIDLGKIREMLFWSNMGLSQIVNLFKIYYSDSESSISVLITYCEPAMEIIIIRYRYSFDIPELLALDGYLTVTPQPFSKAGEYLIHQPISDDFAYGKEPEQPRLTLTLNTGMVAAKDIPRLLEALYSREVEIISPVDGSSIKVIPSMEDFTFPLRPEEPQIFEIKMKVCADDLSLLGALAPDDSDPWRIFSREHNDKFN